MLSVKKFNGGSRDLAHSITPETMRLVIPAVTLIALGYQTVISSFMCGLLLMFRRPTDRS